jgi:glycosyltransferase involved in cell wall biosynthesis
MRGLVLIVAASPEADAVARALAHHDLETRVIVLEPGLRGTLRGTVRALRAAGTARPQVVVSSSPPAAAHLIARLVRRGRRWLACVAAAPELVRDDRWGRVLDPLARALRAADAVVAPPSVAAMLHATAGVAVTAAGDGYLALADGVRREPAGDGLTILMLGTVNTPHVEHLAIAMRDRGHRVVVAGDVVPGYPPSVLPAEGVDVRALELPAMPWVRRVAREVRPDVVHAHWLPAYGFLAAVMRLRPLVAMAWGSDVYKATNGQLRKIRYVMRRADVAMTDSADLLARLVDLGADPCHAHLLNWGVDLDVFSPPADRAGARHRLGLGEGPLVLSPRALTTLYNPTVILDAFDRLRSEVPSAQLVLKHIGVGDPDLGRALPPGARIVGHVAYEELADWYRAADVCVSIPDSDSSPRSVWEAMACGCACVLSDLPWVHELIEDERHALVVPPEPAAVAAAMARLLADPALAGRVTAEARALVERHRDQRAEMDRLSELYVRTAATTT